MQGILLFAALCRLRTESESILAINGRVVNSVARGLVDELLIPAAIIDALEEAYQSQVFSIHCAAPGSATFNIVV